MGGSGGRALAAAGRAWPPDLLGGRTRADARAASDRQRRPAALREYLARIAGRQWLCFTSARSVAGRRAPRATCGSRSSEEAAADQFELVRELGRQLRPTGARVGLEHAGERLSRIERLFEAGLDYVKLDASVAHGVALGRAARELREGAGDDAAQPVAAGVPGVPSAPPPDALELRRGKWPAVGQGPAV